MTTTTRTITPGIRELCTPDFEVPGADRSDCAGKYTGDTCTVSCLSTYEGTPSTYTCLPGQGGFQGNGPSCSKRKCVNTLTGYNASDCDNKEILDWCHVRCLPGYEAASGWMQCDVDGNFQGTLPVCQRMRCFNDSLPTAMGVNTSACNDVLVGSTCSVTCQQDYSGAEATFECQQDGQFSGTIPTCLLQPCDLPSWLSGPGISHNCDAARLGDSCMAQCDVGYAGSPEDQRCNAPLLEGLEAVCSALECTLNYPEGEGVDLADCVGKVTGQSCTPRCAAGFAAQVPANVVTCSSSGAFTSSLLTCSRSVCSPPASISGFSGPSVQTSCSGEKLGDECVAFCAPGYTMTGSAVILRCSNTTTDSSSVEFMEVGAGGLLKSPSPPTCTGETCTVGMPNRLGVANDCEGTTTSQKCTATAAAGYFGGPFAFECNSSGAFTGPEISVTPLQCESNASANVNFLCGDDLGQICWTYCSFGFTGQAAEVVCSFDPEDPPARFVPVEPGVETTCSARRLAPRNMPDIGMYGALPSPHRSLAGAAQVCGHDAVEAAGINQPQFVSDCLFKTDGQACLVACKKGYDTIGNAVVKFCVDGNFTNPGLPVCTPRVCEKDLPDAFGVLHNCSGKRFGENCTATCTAPGYVYAEGATATSHRCEATGAFSGSIPSCQRVSCASLALPAAYHTSECTGYLFGDICVVHCAAGYVLVDSAEVFTCTAAGTFAGSWPACQPARCTQGIPVDSDLDTAGCQSVTTGSTCRVSCAAGFTGGEKSYTCLASGILNGTRPTCSRRVCEGMQPAGTGFTVDCASVAFGESCIVTCREGFQLRSGSSVRFTCGLDAGTGSMFLQGDGQINDMPQCDPVRCHQGLSVGAGIGHNCTGTLTDATCTGFCLPGYTGASTTLTCAGNGSFTGSLPTCLPASCSNAVTTLNTQNDCDSVTFGASCFSRCQTGFLPLVGGTFAYGVAEEWRCNLAAGHTAASWVVSLEGEDQLTCTPSTCEGNPPVGIQFIHNCSGAQTGDLCTVSCSESFYGPNSTLECGAGGEFQGTLPACLAYTSTQPVSTTSADIPGGSLLVATLSRSFTEVLLGFSQPTKTCEGGQCNFGPVTAACGDLIQSRTRGLLGKDPHCLWSSDRRTLHVVLGEDAKIEVGGRVYILPNVLQPAGLPEALPAVFAIVEQGLGTPSLTAVLESRPVQTTTCGQVQLSSTGSSGSFGRALRYSWEFGPGTPTQVQAALADMLTTGGAVLELSAQQMFEAYQTVPSTVQRPLYLEVSLGITNWLGATDNATVRVAVLETTPSWQVTRATPAEATLENFDESRFAVRLLPPSSCSGTAAAREPPPLTWTYRPDAQSAWRSLSSAGLQDLSPSPLEVLFPAFSFDPGSQHELQVHLSGGNAVGFGFTVKPRAAPVVSILGPWKVSQGCHFSLDASNSRDLSVDPTTGPAALNYSWRCTTSTGSTCGSFSTSTTGRALQVAAGTLFPGSYIFTVSVVAADGPPSSTGNGSWAVSVSSGVAPPILVDVAWKSMQRISLDGGTLEATARIGGLGGSCTMPSGWLWQWFVVDMDSGVLLDTISPRSNGILPVAFSPAPLLQSGGHYAVALAGAAVHEVLDSVLQVTNRVADFDIQGIPLARSATFIADRLPQPGLVHLSPLHSTVLEPVSIVAEGWTDATPGRLEYAFYAYKVPQMTLVNGALSCSSVCPVKEVDWTNRSSDDFWLRQGVFLIRSWQTDAAVAENLPIGGHKIIVRVRDSTGGLTSTVKLGPLISSMPNGITGVEAEKALSATAFEESALLNLVRALITASVQAGEESTLGQLLLGGLESAAASFSGSVDSSHQHARALSDMARWLGSNGLDSGLAQLVSIFGSVISDAQFGSDTAEAAEGFLEVLKSMGQVYEAAINKDTVFESRVGGVIRSIANKVSGLVQVGQALFLSSGAFDDPSNQDQAVTMRVEERQATVSGASFFDGTVVLPATPTARRRLTSSCDEVVVSRMDWQKLNFWQDANGEYTVDPQSSMSYLQVSGCGGLLPLQSPMTVRLEVGQRPSPQAEPMCVFLDPNSGEWSRQGMNMQGVPGPNDTHVICETTHSSGFVAVGFAVVLAVTTTTAKTTNVTVIPPGQLSPEPTPTQAGPNNIAIIIVVIGCSIFAVLVLCAICGCCRRRRRKDRRCCSGCCLGCCSAGRLWRHQDRDAAPIREHEGISNLPKSSVNISLPLDDNNDDDDDLYGEDDEEDEPEDDGLEFFSRAEGRSPGQPVTTDKGQSRGVSHKASI